MRRALVTGTSRGVGEALAGLLADRGWQVFGVARSDAPNDLAQKPGYHHERVDLADPSQLAACFESEEGPWARWTAGEPSSRLAVVNNAGALAPMMPIDALSDAEAIARSMTLNVSTPMWLMGWALRSEPNAALRIVNLSSGAATSPYPAWGVYCASKAALKMAGACLDVELGEVPSLAGRDAVVISYAPGVVDTAMQDAIRSSDPSLFPRRERFVALHADGELAPPEGPAGEIARLLESDDLPRYVEERYAPPGR